ncbi:phosphonate ABC transporter, permease protein PhnE [Maritalea mediterranea]|uniref:Phosphonate ABC transporter, permease protein PhnE n=1 Tax=Maritalea mediterranea TaxID=2909667 RepID=A0ABS9E9D5_9HYPH|nr:phosphonate ABC transporter, permease protein PhnE [Maritalea mediterranea]MCF4099452.1 phosphonate ABC transporter, permease protein PhnE [Maritalea mediterranea]
MGAASQSPTPKLSDATRAVHRHYQELAQTKKLYSFLTIGILSVILVAALWFANASNSGKFIDRLPYFFDFVLNFLPDDPLEIFRALFDLPSPYADGSLKYDYEEGRHYLFGDLYLPEYFYEMLVTLNIAFVSTLLGGGIAFVLCFFAASNLVGSKAVRFVVRRIMELLRAFPEIVIAGLLAAILSLGPIAAIAAVSIHTIGALGKLFFEVVENADMKPDEGLRAAGASWIERVRFAIVPQVLPNFTSYALLRAEINVRASTIIGAVGGGGIGEVFRLSLSRDHAAKTYAIILLLFVTIVAVDQLSGWLRRKMVGDQAFQFGA